MPNDLVAKLDRYLAIRPRTEHEVRLRLKRYGCLDPEPIILSLKNQNLLDDDRFAKWFVESRANSRPRSNLHLRLELQKKGISQTIIDKHTTSYELEAEALASLVRKKQSLPRLKLFSYLKSRGFPISIILKELDEQGIKE